MTGRLNSFADMQEAAKGEINRTLSERLDSVSKECHPYIAGKPRENLQNAW